MKAETLNLKQRLGFLTDRLPERPFLHSFLFMAALFAGAFQVFTPFFFNNDDISQLFFAKGVGFGLEPSAYIGYSNISIGWLLKNLYLLSPKTPWFAYYYLSALFLGLWAFLASLFFQPRPAFRVLLFCISCVSIDAYYFVLLHYTILSSLAFQGALFLLVGLYEKGDSRWYWKGFLLSGLCLYLSFAMRLGPFLLAGLSTLPWGLWVFQKHRWTGSRRVFQPFIFIAALALSFLALFDHYGCDPGWKEFKRFNQARINLMDYRDVKYTPQTRPYFDSVGWSENDFRMFESWCFIDSHLYSVEKMQNLSRYFPSCFTDKPASSGSLNDIFSNYFTSQAVLTCLLTFLLFLPLKFFRFFLVNFIWVIALFLYMMYFLKVPERIFLPLLSYLLNLSIYYSNPRSPLLPERHPLLGIFKICRSAFLGLAVLLSFSDAHRYFLLDQERLHQVQGLQDTIARLNPTDQQLYVAWGNALPYEWIPALDDFEIYRNFHILGLGVFAPSPHSEEMIRRFGLGDVLVDLAGKPNVFLICGPSEGAYYTRYMEEKHHLSIRPLKVFSSPFFNVFKIQLRSPPPSYSALGFKNRPASVRLRGAAWAFWNAWRARAPCPLKA